jgi:hypothetical protein
MTTHYARCCLFCLTRLRASPPVLGMWIQTVKFIVKMCQFTSGIWLFSTEFTQLAVGGKWCHTVVHLQKKSVMNCTWLRLSISDSSIIMIGPRGLLLVVPKYMQFYVQFYWWGCQRKAAKLRHLILLSRVTYWAPAVEMMLLELPQLIA